MKKILFIMGFCGIISHANSQTPNKLRGAYEDSHHNVIGIIKDGTMRDQNNHFLGQFKSVDMAFEVINHHHKTIGYIVREKEVQDAHHKTIGYIKFNKDYSTTVEDAAHHVLGTVKMNGTVEDSHHHVVDYEVMYEPTWAGVYYFLLKF